ncbi:glutaminase A [Parvularcula maris]|uniref:Glutaminase n=1 Tax=Parvularcula maris TaxID=2965077 RepID=A0A9X2LA03_9PROT|nr:glutaminase A [Parvularcula maris]MCQ8184807.1 glutaminase A [Parvularcula maris]
MEARVISLSEHGHDMTAETLFKAILPEGQSKLRVDDIYAALRVCGLERTDKRIKETMRNIRLLPRTAELDLEAFTKVLAPENATVIARGVAGDFIIPNFVSFRQRLSRIFREVEHNREGKVADYIPQLARVEPDLWGMGVCTVDGQQFSMGDNDETFCAQSCCKPISYAVALDRLGRDKVHKHVGREPSGRGFNELTLDENGLPHNPMINAGAIMTSSLIRPELPLADRFDHVMQTWRKLCGGKRAGFDNSVFLSERDNADRNFALAYMMREQGAFPKDTDLLQTLDFYFQQCSITVDVRQMAVLAATLANGGVCPVTNQRVLTSETVKDCLSLMYSCGMYDFSGEYAFTVGIPAKSGVSGALFMVVPGICGFALYSPRLDALGNSVRGVDFSKRLVDTFAFHTYAGMVDDHGLIDPRKPQVERDADEVAYMCAAASKGDLGELRRLVAAGVDPSSADYDGRTALHLAACSGQEEALRYLLTVCEDCSPKDRWGHTPLDEARGGGHGGAAELLEASGK